MSVANKFLMVMVVCIRAFVWSLFFLSIQIYSQTANPEFKAFGCIKESAYNQDGIIFNSHQTTFEVEVNGKQWKIITKEDTGHIIQTGTDSDTIYSVLFPPEKQSTNQFANKHLPLATIERGSYNFSGSPYENIVWYALVSSTNINDGRLPAPWLYARIDATAYLFRETINGQLDSGVPEKAQFFVEKSRVKAAEANTNLLVEGNSDVVKKLKGLLRNYPDNFLAAEYDVETTTNLGASLFPLHFMLKRYTVDYPGPFEIFDGIITNIVYSNATNFVPCVSGLAEVSDLRFKNVNDRVDDLKYIISNKWISIDSTNLANLYNLKKSKMPRYAAKITPVKRWPVLILMIATLIVPILLLWKRAGWR